jgi:hypothetical protein
MTTFRLSDRQFGSEFCKLERSLIFDPRFKDVGFVRFISPNAIVLTGSRFMDADKGRVYLVSKDLASRIDDGELVRISIEKVEKAVVPKIKGSPENAYYREVARAIGIEEARIPLPPPTLPSDEFIYRVSSNWRDADQDLLDRIIALLMVSAPSSVYGTGGIGSEGLEVMRASGTGTSRDVSQTIINQLPLEFRLAGRSPYRYSTVDSLKGLIEFENGRSEENSFSILKPLRYSGRLKERGIPIQLPFILKDAELKVKKKVIDLDVLEYQMTALYTPPPSENSVKIVAEELARESHRESVWDGAAISSIDPFSSLRIGLALSRLNIGKQFDGIGYSRRMADPLEGKALFRELMKRGLEEIERRTRTEKVMDEVSTHPWREKLKPVDREIFFELRKKVDNTGVNEFPIGSLDLDIDPRMLEESLQRLNRYGYILYLRSGTVIKLVIDSSPEDQS